MINPIFKKNFLFVHDHCPYCAIARKSANKINLMLPINNQIQIIDCTYYDNYGVITHPALNIFKDKFDSYPTIFLGGVKKEGANSVIEYTAWLKAKLFNKLLISESNEYLPEIDMYTLFDYNCKKTKGRIYCK